MPDPLETYLTELRDIHRSGAGVKETSYYGALANLLNEVGKKLRPRVRCIINLQNAGAGMPDGGLFTPDQFPRSSKNEPRQGQPPSRGAIEVKGAHEDVSQIATTKQVQDYLKRYRQVLVTNYRDFLLLGHDHEGVPGPYESYSLADSESSFWSAVAHPQKMAKEHGERLTEYLKRAMLRRVELLEPKDVAWFLASYAREAKARVEARKDLPELAAIRSALEESLGMKFEGEKGEHFFRSTLVQTLFYGIFSAWVLWDKHHKGDPAARFNWHEAGWYLHVPMISALFQQISSRAQLGPLDVAEVLDWAGEALNRVNRGEFFSKFEEGHAVQYFYEPFLQAFDPELRKDLGVWYTPPEIVQYMVERVDRVLREELDIADGLADPNVYVLDPCCGTGAYLVEVLSRIRRTLHQKGGDALAAQDLKKAAMQRVFGFELLPAPYVISHLQLGLLLQNLGAPLSDEGGERVGVFLTNALTGWEPPQGEKKRLPFLELELERDAAEKVKRETPILVVLGNPPYNGFAGVAVDEERDLSDAYRSTVVAPKPKGQGLNDLCIRFFRMAERRIVEHTGRGIVCLISNYSWLDGASFTGMRERYLDAFDCIWVDSLNGDKYKTGKTTPDGKPDPSVFSTRENREGIQVGTAIAILARRQQHTPTDAVLFRQWWGKDKRANLVESLAVPGAQPYATVTPPLDVGLPYIPSEVNLQYARWPRLPEVLPVSFAGVKTGRDEVIVSIDRAPLVQRMREYFDPLISAEEARTRLPGFMRDKKRFGAGATREYLCTRGFLEDHIVRYSYRPFDSRWVYWEGETKLLDERRAEYFPYVFESNLWLSAGQHNRKDAFYQPQVTRNLADHHLVESNVAMFPLRLAREGRGEALFSDKESDTHPPNLSAAAHSYLSATDATEEDVFYHIVAALHSPSYREENRSALRQDWPRIPLPDSKEALLASAELGKKIAALLDTENPVAGVTSGDIRTELREIAVISRDGGGALDPVAGDLAVTAGWGHAGKGNATMPGAGKLAKRAYSSAEAAAMSAVAGDTLLLYGESTRDVYLNDVAYWRNVPGKLWRYTIGGYQVMKKWLSYREEDLLGRSLTMDEAREVTNMARRIAAILLLEPAMDGNYQKIKANAFPWAAALPK